MTVQVIAARIDSRDPDRLDITRKSATGIGLSFAPSWELLGPFLRRRQRTPLTSEDWAEYVKGYTAEMRRSFRKRRADWDALLARERVVIVCFCVDPTRCHRTILGRDILPKLGALWLGEARR